MFPLRDTIASRTWPFVTWLLVAINAAAFAWELSLSEPRLHRAFVELGVVPERFLAELREHWIGAEWRTIGASMFLHNGWLHVVANVWMLLIFGDNVEDRLGHGRYLLFYFLCGAIAAGAHIGFNPDSAVPTIGASGAIAGVLGGYLIAFPTARVVTIVPVFIIPWRLEVPAFVFLGVWIATQLFSGMSPKFQEAGAGGIAWWAHIGGFAAGLILMPLLAPRRARTPGRT